MQRGAHLKHDECTCMLAFSYRDGRGGDLPQDYDKFVHYLRDAALLGSGQAQFQLYAVLMKTDFESVKEPGIEALHDCKNFPEAMQWLRLAAKQNAMDGLAKSALEEIEAHIRHICQGCNKMRDEGCDDKPYQP